MRKVSGREQTLAARDARRDELRTQAVARGEKFYIPSRPCGRGHLTKRRVSDHTCFECRLIEYDRNRCSRLLSRARDRAKKFNLPFEITIEDVKAAWPADDKCPVLHKPFHHGPGISPFSPSLDKRNPTLGYVRGNIAVMSYRANMLKRDSTDPQEFRLIADWLETTLVSSGFPSP